MFKEVLKKTIINDFYIKYKKFKFKKVWRKGNKHNETVANTYFNPHNVKVGNATYGELNIVQFSSAHNLQIGNFVSIAQEVIFLLDAEHYVKHLSTFPFKVKYLNNAKEEAFGKGDIIIDDDVWLGYRSTIMSGVHIGQGAVIAAGAIVTKDVPPFSIVGGVPAKVIGYRFSDDICKSLINIDYSKLNKDIVEKNIDVLYHEITTKTDADQICSLIASNWSDN